MFTTLVVDAAREREEELEEEATRLLRRAGAFRTGTGVRNPRSERNARSRTTRWTELVDNTVADLGRAPLWDELDAVAEAASLTPEEKAVLGMTLVGEYALLEIAEMLGTTVHRVRVHRRRALKKCQRRVREAPESARTLFWEEIRQKCAAIYRAPFRGFWR